MGHFRYWRNSETYCTQLMVLLVLSIFIILKARLHCKTELNSTVIADKEQGPKTIQSLGLDLGYTKTAVRDPATL